ncbi:uncharacterized protein KY384_001894 [Bacidia gigantensis]|uniref:uncharacterized protein n=1 Tax=Bacidia gigantensis TaxID=2732470 RepID=UPI001D057EA9|nr:uncharacterized protein KY384_001894 [Bacidia gigantensis]KAG8533111.1 hypothetical protein KY384_001894 [Bacidia gigantensis]
MPVPSSFRPRISPTLHQEREAQASPDDHPARDRDSPMPFFGKRIEIPVPNTTPDDHSDIRSLDENYAPTTVSDVSLPPLSPQLGPMSRPDIPSIPRLTYRVPIAPTTIPDDSAHLVIPQPHSPLSTISPRTPSPDPSHLLSGSPFATPTATEQATPSSAMRPHSRADTIPTVNISFSNPPTATNAPPVSNPTSHPIDLPASVPIPPPLTPQPILQPPRSPSPARPPPSHPPQRARPPDPAPFSSMFTSFQSTDPISWDRLARQSDRHRREQRHVPSPGSAISPKSTPMPGFMDVGPWPAPARSGSASYFAGVGAGVGGDGEDRVDTAPAAGAGAAGDERAGQRNRLISVFNTSHLDSSLRPSNSMREQRGERMPHAATEDGGLGVGGPALRRSVSERVAESQRPMTPRVREERRQRPRTKGLGRVRWKGREH